MTEIFNEAYCLLRTYALQAKLKSQRKWSSKDDADIAFCYEMLNKVSRSFAIVIQELPTELRDAICIFYLVLRGLDTIEDDMNIPLDIKIPHLRSFHQQIAQKSEVLQCGVKDYKDLMAKFFHVKNVFERLHPQYQRVIANITQEMGEGMALFTKKQVVSVGDYDKYCHYVAGIVGIGLSQIFATSKLESDTFFNMDVLANDMGVFLQKTNITRDYLEDITEEPEPRIFWPEDIWKLYTPNLRDFMLDEHRDRAVACLNHMVVDAMHHMPSCLQYLQAIQDPGVFRFCALPQVMAIATLATCYNNPAVFKGVVKIRKGLAATIIHNCNDMSQVLTWFQRFLNDIVVKIEKDVRPDDRTRSQALAQAQRCLDICKRQQEKYSRLSRGRHKLLDIVLIIKIVIVLFLFFKLSSFI